VQIADDENNQEVEQGEKQVASAGQQIAEPTHATG
jgi:hypothetical protein